MKTTRIVLSSIVGMSLMVSPLTIFADVVENSGETVAEENIFIEKEEQEAGVSVAEQQLDESQHSGNELPDSSDVDYVSDHTDNSTKLLKNTTEGVKTFNDWFPDAQLATAVAAELSDAAPSEEVSLEKLATLDRLDVRNQSISDMTGLEYLTGLHTLICSGNLLSELDVHANTQLVSLDCANNQLTNLDLSNNGSLVKLFCDNNQLLSLDLSHNPALASVSATENFISNIDFSQNANLQSLYINENRLTSLDLSANSRLTTVIADENRILDFSHVPESIATFSAKRQGASLEQLQAINGVLDYSISAKDRDGKNMVITSVGNGVYQQEKNQIVWSNLADEGYLYYYFNSEDGAIKGGVRLAYTNLEVAAPVISADTEVSYPKNSQLTAERFYADIQAESTEGSTLMSDFQTAVDFSKQGDYVVTLTAENQYGLAAEPVQVTVHVTEDQTVPDMNEDEALTDPEATDAVVDVPSQENTTNQLGTDKAAVAEKDEKVKLKSATAATSQAKTGEQLPKTGDQATGYLVAAGALLILASGVLVFKRRRQ